MLIGLTKGEMRMRNREHQRLIDARICYVCLQPVPPKAGIHCSNLFILVHQGLCYARVERASRDYSRSARGRWVAAPEVLRRLHAVRPTSEARQ